MQQYGLSFGFREPYQVLVDADMLRDADRFKMDLVGGLERILHGKIKPMITQCSMRHLYKAASEPGVSFLIDKAKLFERRRCGHLPEEYPEPLSTKECICSVVDPKDSKTNKHRYVVASQQQDVRKIMRAIKGVPLVYINRSVMIMEPMAGATVETREREERGKFRAGIKSGRASGSQGMKRKRNGEDDGDLAGSGSADEERQVKKKKAVRGPKGPNPLAIKKSKKRVDGDGVKLPSQEASAKKIDRTADDGMVAETSEGNVKRKRRRKHKSGTAGGEAADRGEDGPAQDED